MGRINDRQLKPTRWGMILSAFGQKRGVIFEPEKERLALLKNVCPPKDSVKPEDKPKERRWFGWLWSRA